MSSPFDDWSLPVCKVITLSILVYTRVESVGVELVTAVKYLCCATRIRKCNASTISTSFLISFVSHCKWPLVDLQFASILLAVDGWIFAYVQGDYALNASIYVFTLGLGQFKSILWPRWNNLIVEPGSGEVEKEVQWFNCVHIFLDDVFRVALQWSYCRLIVCECSFRGITVFLSYLSYPATWYLPVCNAIAFFYSLCTLGLVSWSVCKSNVSQR